MSSTLNSLYSVILQSRLLCKDCRKCRAESADVVDKLRNELQKTVNQEINAKLAHELATTIEKFEKDCSQKR